MSRKKDELRTAVEIVKSWARGDDPGDFNESEWRSLMARVAARPGSPAPAPKTAWLRPVLAGAGMIAALVWGALLLSPPSAIQPSAALFSPLSSAGQGLDPFEDLDAGPPAWSEAIIPDAETPAGSTRPVFVWIAPSSGLRIFWFLNDRLTLEK
jgi:hypothetical protein